VIRTKGALDRALEERTTVLRNYRQSKRAQLLMLYNDPWHGEHLRKFVATLQHFGPEHGDRFIEYVEDACRKWLRNASIHIRFAALEACDERCMKIREQLGLAPIDDPLPDEPDSVFLICKKAIGV
jgi:hypothetical protein